ncbi:hypothetical protein F5884DRAFT_150613 [Xylogone sp. PMI_703]|nr:hypothetical protein F5884DRAFT_150613 [Xylogone sp. PMI_703]
MKCIGELLLLHLLYYTADSSVAAAMQDKIFEGVLTHSGLEVFQLGRYIGLAEPLRGRRVKALRIGARTPTTPRLSTITLDLPLSTGRAGLVTTGLTHGEGWAKTGILGKRARRDGWEGYQME